ncbi:non-specific lipid-transfer protein 1-like [Coffea eugenioides]|uniref:Non-specific lipid-transfer protein n=1 Tax=Coffea arabica TaxID=13443 RepID=A0ABM4UWD9_COFAR|nr:non-specific lipid-transfer protein 1-like [Coffea eugenioides]
MAKFAGVACLVLMCMLVAVSLAPHAEAITCGTVAGDLGQCLGYLEKGGVLPPGCCAGIRNLNSQAKTTADRQTACSCLKSLAGRVGNINEGLAAGLPGKCGVNVGYPISTKTDCNSVH